jgi:uncharacterized protein YjbJ (UPF0337 family)
MTQSTKDQVAGAVRNATGTFKEKIGQAIGNPELTADGQNEQVAGIVQKKVGQIEKVLGK